MEFQLQKLVFNVIRDLEICYFKTENKSHVVQTKLFT